MKLGFIGFGNMSMAMVEGLKASKKFNMENIYASAQNKEKLENNCEKLKINATKDNQDCIDKSDLIFIGVKPESLHTLNLDFKGKPVISMAAKTNFEALETFFGPQNFYRIMPNLNVKQNMGVIALSHQYEKNLELYYTLSLLGHVYEMEEHMISGFIALAGSSPALMYRFIDALSDAVLDEGFTKQEALEIVSYTMMGSAQTVLNAKESPKTLVEKVSSKGGTTIEGLKVFDDYHFEDTMKKAARAIIDKDKMGMF